MATSEIRTKMSSEVAFTITLASLANASARQSSAVSNSNSAPAALISVRLKSGAAAPTVGTVYEVYLWRDTGTITDDGLGASDAAATIENCPLLGTIVVTATANKTFYGIFDTAPLGPLGPTFGIAIKNSTGQTISTTEADHAAFYNFYVPEAQ